MAGILTVGTGIAFALLSDDIVLNIFMMLEGDPRDWARLACVSTRFSALVQDVCYRVKCSRSIPAVISDLLSPHPPPPGPPSSAVALVPPAAELPPGGWAALYKLSICCPGPLLAGVLLENSDFGLEREIGPDENYRRVGAGDPRAQAPSSSSSSTSSSSLSSGSTAAASITPPLPDCSWSLFDDLYFDTVYDPSESFATAAAHDDPAGAEVEGGESGVRVCRDVTRKRRKQCEGPLGAHLAAGGAWNLCREQGNKLLASRFRGDCLYICDWPGCVHAEEKRNYMLFRGFFKNFKRSRVWRTINDGGNRTKIGLDCAFCPCRETWDLHSAFCLRRVFGFHDDGEPVVRAYVCENGHVSGAWTDRPMYT
uniref:Phytochrome A-associated F-box protein n=1 Tax=Anthurium amnicola TaxID=1678845 RepID=A0A1D1XZ73_9ARAE